MLKSDLRTLIKELIEDPKATRWSGANLDLLTGVVFDRYWGDILRASAWYASQTDTLTTLTAPGRFDVAKAGDLTQRFFRLQKVVRNAREYAAGDSRDFVLESAAQVAGTDFSYYWLGDLVYLLPLSTTDDVEVTYSFLPALYTDLADDKDIVWPEGHDLALAFSVAGYALYKGAVEDPQGHMAAGRDAFNAMLADIVRRQIGPLVVWTADTPEAWGGT